MAECEPKVYGMLNWPDTDEGAQEACRHAIDTANLLGLKGKKTHPASLKVVRGGGRSGYTFTACEGCASD